MTVQAQETTSLICKRCGADFILGVDALAKRKERGTQTDFCGDCAAKPARFERHGELNCKPWQGDIDLDTMTPVDTRGRPYMPGIRLCGHSDCVNSAHVFGSEQAIAEQFDISYRTGRKLNFTQLRKAVKNEAIQR